MDEQMSVGLKEQIIADLHGELSTDGKIFEEVLTAKVDSAIREVRNLRNYPEHYTYEMIEKDLLRFYSQIKAVALYDYKQVGAEYQTSYTENGIARGYVDRGKILRGVTSISRLI